MCMKSLWMYLSLYAHRFGGCCVYAYLCIYLLEAIFSQLVRHFFGRRGFSNNGSNNDKRQQRFVKQKGSYSTKNVWNASRFDGSNQIDSEKKLLFFFFSLLLLVFIALYCIISTVSLFFFPLLLRRNHHCRGGAGKTAFWLDIGTVLQPLKITVIKLRTYFTNTGNKRETKESKEKKNPHSFHLLNKSLFFLVFQVHQV